jgi:DNA-binding HxlR family transcriptional regulator
MTSDDTFCPVHAAIQLLQEKWMLHIVRALLPGPLGFNELGRTAGGCNPATLAQRLDRLEELGIVTRTVEQVMPPRTSYRLTESGTALQEVIDSIDRWGRRWIDERMVASPAR